MTENWNFGQRAGIAMGENAKRELKYGECTEPDMDAPTQQAAQELSVLDVLYNCESMLQKVLKQVKQAQRKVAGNR